MGRIGYKATDKDMKCRGTQYNLTDTFWIENGEVKSEKSEGVKILYGSRKENLKLCSKDVIHYCNELKNCYDYYSPKEEKGNRFFKVETLGDFVEGGGKNGTTALRFIEEVDMKPIREKIELDKMDKKLNLDKVRKLQAQFPYLILGGSTALWLQGAKLKRLESSSSDLDLIHPFWIDLTEAESVNHIDAKNSGNTFDETYTIGGTKIDFTVEPNEKYNIVEFNGHTYKVNPIERIIQFKSQYAQQKNGEKHRNDLIELTTGKRPNGQ